PYCSFFSLQINKSPFSNQHNAHQLRRLPSTASTKIFSWVSQVKIFFAAFNDGFHAERGFSSKDMIAPAICSGDPTSKVSPIPYLRMIGPMEGKLGAITGTPEMM